MTPPAFPPTAPGAPSDAPPEVPGSGGHDRRTFIAAVLALGLGSFAIGTGEFVIMGLLPEVAASMKVDIPTAGHAISAYAMGVVIGSPILAVLGASWPRRTLLVWMMALYAAGHLASALAPGFLSLNAIRFVAGLPHGTYFGTAALVAAALAPPGRRASAVALVMTGLTVANLLGVPLAVWIGQHLGWRASFVLVGVIAAAAALLVWRRVPQIAAARGASPMRELSALARPQVWLTFAIGAIGFGGMFAVYSYIKPILTEAGGIPIGWVPLVLALFGAGMVAGNLIGARFADRSLTRAIAGLMVWNAVVLLGFVFSVVHPLLLVGNVLLLGTLVAIAPALQIRLMDVAGEAQTLAAALNHSAFNLANALGAWIGGAAIAAGLGWTSPGWVGALLALAGMAVFALAVALGRRERASRQASGLRQGA